MRKQGIERLADEMLDSYGELCFAGSPTWNAQRHRWEAPIFNASVSGSSYLCGTLLFDETGKHIGGTTPRKAERSFRNQRRAGAPPARTSKEIPLPHALCAGWMQLQQARGLFNGTFPVTADCDSREGMLKSYAAAIMLLGRYAQIFPDEEIAALRREREYAAKRWRKRRTAK